MSNRGTTRWQMRREAAAVMSRAPDFRAGYSRTVTGNLPLSLPDSAGCRLDGLTIRGATDASGTPVAQSKSLTVTVRGKNLIDETDLSKIPETKDVTLTDGSVVHCYTLNGYLYGNGANKSSMIVRCSLGAGSYRMRFAVVVNHPEQSKNIHFSYVLHYYDGTSQQVLPFSTGQYADAFTRINRVVPVTAAKDVTAISFGWYKSGGSGAMIVGTLQIEEGSVATAYEPYYEDSITVPLPHPLAYGSSVDLAAGVMNTNYLSFVPNEVRIYASDDDTITFSYYDAVGLDKNIFRDDVSVYASNAGTVDCYVDYQNGMYYHCLYVTTSKDSTGQTVEDWLSAHPDPIYIYPDPHRDAISHKEVIDAPKLPRTPVGSAFVQIGRGEPETTATVQYRSMTKEATT